MNTLGSLIQHWYGGLMILLSFLMFLFAIYLIFRVASLAVVKSCVQVRTEAYRELLNQLKQITKQKEGGANG